MTQCIKDGTMKRRKVEFYQNDLGHKPVSDWLLELIKDDRRIIGEDIKTLEFGWPKGMPLCRPLGSGLFEVRSSLNSNKIARIIFCTTEENLILLHGFIKKTQKTPNKELDIALKRKRNMK